VAGGGVAVVLKRLRRSAACLVAKLGVVALVITGCGLTQAEGAPEPPDCGQPTEGQIVVVLVSGTAHEPRPSLTSRAEQALRDAANSDDASDGRNSRGSVAVIASADGEPREVLPLTPRRANCAVEHGLQRPALIDENIERVRVAVASRAAVRPGLDLMEGIAEAVRGLDPALLIVLSSGMSTEGGFDLRQVGWDEDPSRLVAHLTQHGLLHDLLPGWRVLFTGLGETAGDSQPPLTKPVRDKLVDYWSAICTTAVRPGGSCAVDESPLDPVPPLATAESPVVDVPGVDMDWGSSGGPTTATLFDQVLGFGPDSAALSSDARSVLRAITERIAIKLADHPDLTIGIRGYVADPPDSTPAGRERISEERARAVADFVAAELNGRGLSPVIDTAGAGTPPDMTAIVDGAFDEAIATQMRKVTITY
jgi:outer membrane protein OmpA-like peptidoglycan-associated protein